MSFDYKHDLVLGRKEPQLVPQHCIDYDILVDDTPVKASWLRNTTLAECAEWFKSQMDSKFVVDLAYFLARTSIGLPVTNYEINDCIRGAMAQEKRILQRRIEDRRRKRREKRRTMRKVERQVTVKFD